MNYVRVFHLEANGGTNTAEYVKNIIHALDDESNISVFTSKNSFHSSFAKEVFGDYGKSRGILKLFWYIIGWVRIWKELKKNADSIVFHVHWLRFSPVDYFFLKRIKNNTNVKLFFTVHNILPHETLPFDERFYRKIYPLFNCLIFHSKQNQSDFNARFKLGYLQQEIIPHYSYNVSPHIPPVKDEIQMLFFGAIRPYKGLELLIEALSLLNITNWKLIIAGKPEYNIEKTKENIFSSELLKGRISLKEGWINDDEIPSLFQNSHIVILPYLSIDNSGLVHLAMSYGKTVIVPEIGVFNDIIKDGKNGYYFRIGDAVSLSNTIEKVVSNTSFDRVGVEAIHTMNGHSLEQIGEKIKALYLDAI